VSGKAGLAQHAPINLGVHTVEVHAGESCEVLKGGGIQPVHPLDDQPRDTSWSKDVSSN
jgi:hypothetical protein